MTITIKRKPKPEDSIYDIHNPESACWWRYLEPEELNIFQNDRTNYGLTDIPEAQRCLKMCGRRCQKMAWSKAYVSQWENKTKGGKYLRIPLAALTSAEYEIDAVSGFGFVRGRAAVNNGKLEE